MKILFPYMARWKAVNWTRYHSLLTALAEDGHEVYVLQPPRMRSEETNFQEIEVDLPNNLHLIDVDVPGVLWNRAYPIDKLVKKALYSICSLRVAKKFMKSTSVEVILLYNIPQYPYLSFFSSSFIVFDCADDYLAMLAHELGSFRNPLFMSLGKAMLLRMISRSNLVFSVSNVLAGQYGHRPRVLPNGVDVAKVENAKKHPLGLNLRRPVIGFVGSFEYFIDFDLILDAAGALPDATFLLVGKGREWERVMDKARALALANIVFPGGIPHQDVFRYIGEMDICLNIFKPIPISHGACPIKLFEYLSMKKPVISTRLDELGYIDKGFLEYADTAEELISAIRQLLSDPKRMSEMAEAGNRKTLASYTWPKIAHRFVQAISPSLP